MTNTTTQLPAMQKEFIFKGANSGTSKKSGKPYAFIELHDPETLENSQYFLREGQTIHTADLSFKQRVVAGFNMNIFNGRPTLELTTLTAK